MTTNEGEENSQPDDAMGDSLPTPPLVTLTPDEQSDLALDDVAETDEEELLQWTATEYVHRHKNALWFILFGLATIGMIAFAILVISSITFAILIPVMATALLVYAYRPPRELVYMISNYGVHANDHLYPFMDFKAFAVVHGDDEYSVMLLPTKRFRPGVSIYFPEEYGERIVDTLAARLPMEQFHIDLVDRIIRALRI